MSMVAAVRSTLRVWWVPYVVLALFVGLYTGSAQQSQPGGFSPLDEYQYHDYLTKVPTQGFVRHGEEIGEATRQISSCDGVMFFGPIGIECGVSPQEPDEAFPHEGLNSADIYTPAYFAITWVLSQPFTWLGLELLEAGRAVGGIWLFAGLAALFALQRRLGVASAIALGVSLAVIALPATYWSSQFISTDAPTYVVGAGLGLLGVRLAQGRGRLWELPFACALAVAFKVNNIAAVGVTLLALGIFACIRRSEATEPGQTRPLSLPRALLCIGLSAIATVVAYGTWLVIRSAASVGPGADIDAASKTPLTVRALLDESLKFVLSVGQVDMFESNSTWEMMAGSVFVLMGVGSIGIALAAQGAGNAKQRAIAGATAILLVVFGPTLALMTSLIAGYYVPLTGRYGVVFVVPYALLIGLAAAHMARRTWPILGIGALLGLVAIVGQ